MDDPWQDARALLEAAGLGVPIEWPNELKLEPDVSVNLWLRVDITGDDFRPMEMGPNGAWREEGELFVDILARSGTGTLDARFLAKRITNLFRGLGPRPVIWRRATLGLGTDTEDRGGNWWLLPVSVSYEMSQ